MKGNSGVYVRGAESAPNGMAGLQVDLFPPDYIGDIEVMTRANTGGTIVRSPGVDTADYFRTLGWNDLIITARGPHVTVTVNGVTTAELKDYTGRSAGAVALQLCNVGASITEVRFTNVEIRGLGGQTGDTGRSGGDLRQSSQPAASASKPAGPHPDLAAIEGNWQVTAVRRNGEVAAVSSGDRYVFANGVVTIHTAGNFPAQLRCTLDPTRTPKQLDLEFGSGDDKQVSPMVYELQGDTLRICYSEPGIPRPAELATTPSDRRTLITMSRKETNPPGVWPATDQEKQPEARVRGFISPFTSESLRACEKTGNAEWSYENGVLHGRDERGALLSQETFADLDLTADVKINADGNSGVHFRANSSGNALPNGYQVQIIGSNLRDKGATEYTGSLTVITSGGYRGMSSVSRNPIQDDQWFQLRLLAQGNHFIVQIDGKTVADYVDSENRCRQGRVGLEQWGRTTVVSFRNVRVRRLASTQQNGESRDSAPPQRRSSGRSYVDYSGSEGVSADSGRAYDNARYQADRALRDFRTRQLQSHPYSFQPGNPQSWQPGRW